MGPLPVKNVRQHRSGRIGRGGWGGDPYNDGPDERVIVLLCWPGTGLWYRFNLPQYDGSGMMAWCACMACGSDVVSDRPGLGDRTLSLISWSG